MWLCNPTTKACKPCKAENPDTPTSGRVWIRNSATTCALKNYHETSVPVKGTFTSLQLSPYPTH
eukprot:m.473328 g.473328  ORF g.473328 m.473328 type:complete len:64 (-) comp34177_c0_seq1:111-302(-)